MTTPTPDVTPALPILPLNTGQQPQPAQPGGAIPPGGIGYAPNALLADSGFPLRRTDFSQSGTPTNVLGWVGGPIAVSDGVAPFRTVLDAITNRRADPINVAFRGHENTAIYYAVAHGAAVTSVDNFTLAGYGWSYLPGRIAWPVNVPRSPTSPAAPTEGSHVLYPLGFGVENSGNNPPAAYATGRSAWRHLADTVALLLDGLFLTAGPNYAGRDLAIAASYYPALAAYYIGFAYGTAVEPLRVAAITLYNAQATALNNDPRYANPLLFLSQQLTQLLATVTATVGTVTTTVNGLVAALTAEAGKLKAQADATVAAALVTAGQQVQFLQQQAAAVGATADAAIKGAQTTLAQQQAIIQAEVDKQKAAAEAKITQAMADAGKIAADATLLATNTVAAAVAEAGRIQAAAIAEITRLLFLINSLVADRPLYYGALATPITVTAPTDVIVIPPGGLTITAN